MIAKPFNKSHTLRENQAVLVLDDKGNFQCLYALRNEKVYKITFKKGKQKTEVIFLDDLTNLLSK